MTARVTWVPFVADRRVASVRMRSARPARWLGTAPGEVRTGVESRPEPGTADVLVLQKAYRGEHREMAERHRARGTAVVLDLCDNHFYNPDGDPTLAERSDDLRRTIDLVDTVSVCTAQMGELVDHPSVLTVADALDPVHGADRVGPIARAALRVPRVLWFGTAGAHGLPFGMRDLERVLPDLAAAAREATFELVVCSNSRDAYRRLDIPAGLVCRYVPWRRSTFPLVAASSTAAVLPVTANPVTRVKTSNRVATALRHGLATVADRLPSYEPYEGSVAFGSFTESLVAYLRDEELRRRHVTTGRRVADAVFGRPVVTADWEAVVQEAMERRAAAGA